MPGYEDLSYKEKHLYAKRKMDLFDSYPREMRQAIANANHGLIAAADRYYRATRGNLSETLAFIAAKETWHKMKWREALVDGTANRMAWQAPQMPLFGRAGAKAQKQVKALNDLLA